MGDHKNLHHQSFAIGRKERQENHGHGSVVLWFTGFSGSGKSSLASAVEQNLFQAGMATYILDGDNLRSGLNKDLDFTDQGRKENIRRVAETARLFCDAGVVTLTSFISPFKKDREQAKAVIGSADFVEVFVDCPIEVCIERDVKGLYQKALKGEIPNFTGISSPYEAPDSPDLRVDTDKNSLDSCTQQVLDYLLPRLKG